MKKLMIVLCTLILGASLSAKVKPAGIISDNMVLQQQSDAALWGMAEPGVKITITTTWSKAKTVVNAGEDGKWFARVATPAAGGPYEITFNDGDKVTLKGKFSNSYGTEDLKNVTVTYEIEIKAVARVNVSKDHKVKVTYTVTVVDEGGNPVSGAFVQLCLEACVPCMTTEQGVATYPNMDEADYKVSFITVPAGYELPTENYYFEDGSYELTLVLKAVA